jgi:TonB family protein
MQCRAILATIILGGSIHSQTVPGVGVPPVGASSFTAQETILWTHQVNGQIATSNLQETVARDSQGRVHSEMHSFSLGVADAQLSLNSFSITDPVASTRTNCDIKLRVCHITGYHPATSFPDPPVVYPGVPQSKLVLNRTQMETDESLGDRVIDNLPVTGIRRTLVPVDHSGQPRKADFSSSVTEYWYSRDLKMILSSSRSFAANERQDVNVKILSQAEPDLALFTVPANFEVKDDHNSLTDLSGRVSQPVLLSSAEPRYTPLAREQKVNGSVLISLIVNVQGFPQNVQIIQGLGYGLDENAVAAVEQYRFKPAMLDGKPVAVELNVQVTFKIF